MLSVYDRSTGLPVLHFNVSVPVRRDRLRFIHNITGWVLRAQEDTANTTVESILLCHQFTRFHPVVRTQNLLDSRTRKSPFRLV
jgi:hypothetical protein|eukprot:COSAG01_NODE_6302_length_3746_cov_35.050727_1_plen_84_part_00